MKGKRKCDDLSKCSESVNHNVTGHENWNGAFGTLSNRQQHRRRLLCNRTPVVQSNLVEDMVNERRYAHVGNVISDAPGFAEGGVLLDFEDSTTRLLSKKPKGSRYSRDYTYECLFRQSGSVMTQGGTSNSGFARDEQSCSQDSSVQNICYGLRKHPLTSLEGCSMDNQNNQGSSVNKGPVILDFENSAVHVICALEVPCSLQVGNDMRVSASRSDNQFTTDCSNSSVFRDPNSVNGNGQSSLRNAVRRHTEIGSGMGSRRRHNTEKQTFTHISYGSSMGRAGAQNEGENSSSNIGHSRPGVRNTVGSRRGRTMPCRPLSNILSASNVPSGPAQFQGDCDCMCEHCDAKFWYGERLKGHSNRRRAVYHKCCSGGKVRLPAQQYPPQFIRQLFRNRRFMENIRAYNQMFSMTSFGARVEESINNGRAPYVFKISGEIYHWICSLCPIEGDPPRFLQLYTYDTANEVANTMRHFGGTSSGTLDEVQGLIGFLDEHNELVRLFRTARDRCGGQFVPDFKIRLYSVVGARQYDLPTSQTLGGIVFQNGQDTETDYDVIIESRGGRPQRINKLHSSYMSLQFPLFHYLDALAICRTLGNPQFFITFTCNVNWPEIKRHMQCYPEVLPGDRADVVVRVFQQKVQSFCKFLTDSRIFGTVTGLLYTIEFQKRGLPHCHTLLWIDEKDKIQHAEDIDRYISAELPDPIEDPEGYRVVSEMMVHGPCGPPEPAALPKRNRYLHNEMGRGFGQSLHDGIVARITRHVGESHAQPDRAEIQIDEIQNFVDGRYICPYEAFWRIFKFKIHSRQPAVQILSVHLENMQFHTDGRQLTYLDFPKHFVWYAGSKTWSPRRRTGQGSIGRLAHVHPSAGELFYLRILLCHQKGCKSFEDIRTVNHKVYPTFRAACEAFGLLGDDKEWDTALLEACFSSTPNELRNLFAQLLIFCEVSDPMRLWRKYWERMSDDIPLRVSEEHHIPGIHINNPELEQYALFELEIILKTFSKTISDFGLPTLSRHLLDELI
ncbi:DNA helicase [Tanacetum coccineum]